MAFIIVMIITIVKYFCNHHYYRYRCWYYSLSFHWYSWYLSQCTTVNGFVFSIIYIKTFFTEYVRPMYFTLFLSFICVIRWCKLLSWRGLFSSYILSLDIRWPVAVGIDEMLSICKFVRARQSNYFGFLFTNRRLLMGIAITIINLGRSDNRRRFIMGIHIPTRRCLLSK